MVVEQGDRLASKSLVGGAESDGKGIEGSIQGIDVGISGGLGGKGRCRKYAAIVRVREMTGAGERDHATARCYQKKEATRTEVGERTLLDGIGILARLRNLPVRLRPHLPVLMRQPLRHRRTPGLLHHIILVLPLFHPSLLTRGLLPVRSAETTKNYSATLVHCPFSHMHRASVATPNSVVSSLIRKAKTTPAC
jgi:hypothetical protein